MASILRIAEAEQSLTVSAQTFSPLPGAEISAVKHVINGDVGSMEIRFAHSDGGTLDTAELNTGFWDGAHVEVYPGRPVDAACARRSDLHRPDRHGDDQPDRLIRIVRYSRPYRTGRGVHSDLSADVPDGSVQCALRTE